MKLTSGSSDKTYAPVYRAYDGKIVEMKPNSAKISKHVGIESLEFNLEADHGYHVRLDHKIRNAKINDLRAAIFQTGEDTEELRIAKQKMNSELNYAEKVLLINYIRTATDLHDIK